MRDGYFVPIADTLEALLKLSRCEYTKMTLPKKGTRSISINGVLYRWSVRRKPTYLQGIGQSHMSVAVEREDAPQQTLRIILPVPRRDNWLLLPGYVVKPSDIARWVPKALTEGWVPHMSGAAFDLVLSESDLDEQSRAQ